MWKMNSQWKSDGLVGPVIAVSSVSFVCAMMRTSRFATGADLAELNVAW
jgi:hypothetical protein